MASLGDLTLFINAETNRASRDINDLGKQADKVSSKKRDIDFSVEKARNSIRDFKRDLATVGDTAKAAFKVAKMEGLLDDEIESAEILAKKVKQVGVGLNEARKPGQLLQKSFDGLAGSAVGIVNSLAKVGFALYGLQQITGVLQQAFGGLFSGTVGEAVRLQESILKTQTALASTNDVLRNGQVITEPYEAIVALTGTIEKRIDSIRQRSLDLAGVTSQEVIEVFGMVAQQVGQIGGSLQDAEDLAISFAGALGTFGIPLYQARQEIGSILRGDITTDSYLAKALGITNEDVKKAKQSTEGVIGFLNSKLATAVAGQQLAARSFSGVTSNLRDFVELTGEAFGKPLVQPLIDGLTVVYDLLVGIKDEALGAASGLGTALAGASQIIGGGVRGQAQQSGGGDGAQAAQAAKAQVDALGQAIGSLAADIQTTFSQLALLVVRTFAKVGTGLKNLAVGFASLNVEVFKSLLETVTALAYAVQPLVDGFAGLLGVYGSLLQTPVVEYFASIVGQFKLLETIGVGALVKVLLTTKVLVAGFAKLKAAVVGVMAFMGKAFASAASFAGAAMQAFATALTAVAQRLGLVTPQMTALIAQLNMAGGAATKAGAGMATAGGGALMLGNGIKGLLIGILKFNVILLAAQLAIAAVVEAFARFQRAQKDAEAITKMDDALISLNTTLKDVDENSSAAQQAMKEVAEANAQAGIEKLKKKFVEADKAASDYEKRVIALREQNEAAGGGAFGNTASALKTAERNLSAFLVKRLAAEKALTDAVTEYQKTKDKERLAEDITTRRKEYGKLSEQLAKARIDFNRQIQDREFQAQQELARKNLELFQAQEQIKIRTMERRNRKLIEGEEGASAAALQALNTFIAEKKRGELAIKSAEQDLIIANADVERQIANYRFDIERKIAELKKKGLEMAVKEAKLKDKEKQALAENVDIPDLDKPTQTVQAVDLGLASADGFASATRAAQGVQAQINDFRAQGQDLTNKDNLDSIVTSLLPNVPLEQLQDSAIKAAAMLDELAKGLDPEIAKAQAEATAENLIMQREVGQAVEGLSAAYERGEITADEYNAVVAAIQERYNGPGGILEQLKLEANLRIKSNELLKQANQIQSLQRDAKSGTLRTDQNIIMGNAQMAAGVEFDKFRQNEILAQGRIDARRAELEQDGPMSESVAAEFEKFSQTELFNAERQAEMDAMMERFQQLGQLASGVGNAISTAFTQGFADILSGSASVQDVLGNMFQSIADSFMQMAQKIIADMIKMLIYKSLLGLFGGGGGSFFGGASIGEGVSMPGGVGIGAGGGTMQNSMGQGFGTFGPNFGIRQFAKGGIVTGPTAAMIGEGGMNEAVVPLPNGKAIPVDFGKGGKMGGDVTSNVTVNVDSSGGSQTEMSGDDAGKLGKAIDVAVKRVIMEERRSGGLLYNGRR